MTLAWAGMGVRWPWMVALGALLALAACQSAGEAKRAEPADDWRVVERVGHARFQPPGASEWMHVPAAGIVPGGSRVITGRGGRLILADAGRQVVAGTACELQLPEGAGPSRVRQTAGQVRYRVLDGAALTVETPYLAAQMAAGVLDVSMGPDGAEARVAVGETRIVTPDGRAGITLEAGQAAIVLRQGRDYLLARRGDDGRLEPVLPILQATEQSGGAVARLNAPQPRLLAALGLQGAGRGWSAPQQVAGLVDAATATPPQPAGRIVATAQSEPAPSPEPAHEPSRPSRLAAPEPLRSLVAPSLRDAAHRQFGIADAATGAAAAGDVRLKQDRSGPAPGRADVVIVPARYRTAQADEGQARVSGPKAGVSGGSGQPQAARRAGQGAGAAAMPPADERQVPFDRLGAGLLEGLAPAEPRRRDGLPGSPAIPAARRL